MTTPLDTRPAAPRLRRHDGSPTTAASTFELAAPADGAIDYAGLAHAIAAEVLRRLPDPVLVEAREALNNHYGRAAGQVFETAGLCFYRTGDDSVAWHGDRVGRTIERDTMVAILSVGAERSLSVRPKGGGPTLKFPVGHGDLIVMGGSCQRTYEHAILKTKQAVGPRISIQFRPVWPR